MARNAIESEFRTSKMSDGSHFVKNFKTKSFALIWNGQKCDRNIIFEHPKWPPNGSHFVKNLKNKKSCVSIWNGQKCDRKRISDIQNGRRLPFCKNFQKKVPYWSEMARNAIESEFRTSKMAAGSHFVKKSQKQKLWYWSEIVRSDFWTSKMATGSHFLKNIYKLREWFEQCSNRLLADYN